MNQLLKRLIAIFVIVFVLGTAAALLLVREPTPHFWISYGAGVIALAAVTFGGFVTSRDADQPSSYQFETIPTLYLVGVALAIGLAYVWWHLPLGWYAAIHLVLLAAMLVGLVSAEAAHRYIVDQGQQTRSQVLRTRLTVERVQTLVDGTADLPDTMAPAVRQTLEAVAEKLRYTDPMEPAGAAAQGQAVAAALDRLEQLADGLADGLTTPEALQQQANAAIRAIEAWDRAKKCCK